MKETKFLIIIISGIITIGIIYLLAYKLGFSQGFNKGIFFGEKQNEIKWQNKINSIWPKTELLNFDGKIKEIQENLILVEVTIPPSNPFEEPIYEIKNIKVTPQTLIIKQIPFDYQTNSQR